MEDTTGGKFTFNTGMRQVEFIADASNFTGKLYYEFRYKPSEKRWRKLKNMLETFTLTVIARADQDDLEGLMNLDDGDVTHKDVMEKIDDLPDEYSDLDEQDAVNKVRTYYIDVLKLMKKLSLDIPRESETDPDHAF